MLTISVIRGTNSALHSFRSHVGKGSSSHDLTGDSLIILHISASVASIKVFSGTPEKQFVTEPPVCVSANPSSLLMFNILLVKVNDHGFKYLMVDRDEMTVAKSQAGFQRNF